VPIQRCVRGGKNGFKAGPSGFCYIGTGARAKAQKQLSAIKASQARNRDGESRLDIDEATALSKLGLGRNRTSKRKVRFKKVPKWLLPIPIEREYQKRLTAIVTEWQKETNRTLTRQLPGLVEEGRIELNLDAFSDTLDQLIGNLQLEVEKDKALYGVVALDIGEKTAKWNDTQWKKTMNRVVGVTPFASPGREAQLASFTSDNVQLITKLGNDTISDIQGVVSRGIKQGQRHEEIAKEIQERFGVSKSRAQLIGRDQVSKFNGQLTEANQTSVGITEYIWRDSSDQRVRSSHAAHDGKKFKWSEPPADTGHPGQDYQCRCWAEPVFDDLAEAIDAKPPLPSTPPAPPKPPPPKEPDLKPAKPVPGDVDKGLSPAAQRATERYVVDYEDLNTNLRLGTPTEANREFARDLQKAIDESAPLAKDTVFYRGMEFDSKTNPFLGNFKKGFSFSDEGFSSLTTDIDIARDFARGGGFGDVQVLMKVDMPKGIRLAKIPSGLDEFILSPSKGPQRFIVDKVEKQVRQSGTTILNVSVRYIPDPSDIVTGSAGQVVKLKPGTPITLPMQTNHRNTPIPVAQEHGFSGGTRWALKPDISPDEFTNLYSFTNYESMASFSKDRRAVGFFTDGKDHSASFYSSMIDRKGFTIHNHPTGNGSFSYVDFSNKAATREYVVSKDCIMEMDYLGFKKSTPKVSKQRWSKLYNQEREKIIKEGSLGPKMSMHDECTHRVWVRVQQESKGAFKYRRYVKRADDLGVIVADDVYTGTMSKKLPFGREKVSPSKKKESRTQVAKRIGAF